MSFTFTILLHLVILSCGGINVIIASILPMFFGEVAMVYAGELANYKDATSLFGKPLVFFSENSRGF